MFLRTLSFSLTVNAIPNPFQAFAEAWFQSRLSLSVLILIESDNNDRQFERRSTQLNSLNIYRRGKCFEQRCRDLKCTAAARWSCKAVSGFHEVRNQIVSVHAMMAFDGG